MGRHLYMLAKEPIPVVTKKYSMADLLSQVTDENIHAEEETADLLTRRSTFPQHNPVEPQQCAQRPAKLNCYFKPDFFIANPW